MSATDSAAKQRDVILFDGVCHLCSGTVVFVLKRDRARRFAFATLQSEVGQTILGRAGLPLDENETLVLVEGDRITRVGGFRPASGSFRTSSWVAS